MDRLNFSLQMTARMSAPPVEPRERRATPTPAPMMPPPVSTASQIHEMGMVYVIRSMKTEVAIMP